MSQDDLTDEEKRTLASLEPWKDAWNTHGKAQKLVDEIYADSAEVFTPLQGVYHAKRGGSKENWRKLEIELEKIWEKREQRIVNTVVQGNRVAIECEVEMHRIDGKVTKGWYAAFLTFDEDGRLTCDHTYMEGPRFAEWVKTPELDMVPDLKKAMENILAAQ